MSNDPFSSVDMTTQGPFSNGISRYIPVVGGWSGPLTDAANTISNWAMGSHPNTQPQPSAYKQPTPSATPPSGISQYQTDQFIGGQPSQQQAFDPRQQFMQAIMQPFQFDRNAVDTSMFDKMLENQKQQIENTRGLAQNNYNLSNKNIGDMYSAFQNHLAGQAPAIDQRYAQANKDTAGVFDNTTQKNNDWLNNYNAQKAEMLQRLGIQAAGNSPDLVGQAVAQGNNSLNESKDSRLALNDADKQTQQNWFQNMNAMAGNEGLQRQQDLARSLGNINNNLNNQYLQDQSQALQNKMGFIGQMYGNAFQNYQNERDFNEKAFEDYNKLMLEQPKYNAQTALAQARTLAAQAAMGKNVNSGITGLNNSYNPQVATDFQTLVSNGVDPTNISALMQAYAQKNSNPQDRNTFFQYATAYNNMGKTNNFPMNINVDASQ